MVLDSRGYDSYSDPENYDGEHQCRRCGLNERECEGPPVRCCEACEHWTPEPLAEEER